MNGIFAISLDFELHWGGFEKWTLKKIASDYWVPSSPKDRYLKTAGTEYNSYFFNTRRAILEMLNLFEQHEVHVTWATVGLLMHADRISLEKHIPSLKPGYDHTELSAYRFIEKFGIGNSESEDPYHYADTLVRKIIATPHQELGSHSFSHYYCNESGQTIAQFRADLQAAQKAAASYGKKLRSLVFPRNQYNREYLEACWQQGFDTVRANPLDWFWDIQSTWSESKWKRLNRGLDAYIPIGKKNTYTFEAISMVEGLPICQPASRLLRPYQPAETVLNQIKINRIKSEIRRAARAGEIYHLWWHPHNFGRYPSQSLQGLEEILAVYHECKEEWGMMSMNMGEITDWLRKLHEEKTTP